MSLLENNAIAIRAAETLTLADLQKLRYTRTKDVYDEFTLKELGDIFGIKKTKGMSKEEFASLIYDELQVIKQAQNALKIEKSIVEGQQKSELKVAKELYQELVRDVVNLKLQLKDDGTLPTEYDYLSAKLLKINAIVISLVASEKANYEESTVSSRRSVIIKNLMTEFKANRLTFERPESAESDFNLFCRTYHTALKELTEKLQIERKVNSINNSAVNIQISVSELYRDAHKAIDKVIDGCATQFDWKEISKAIALFTGRRMIEIHATAIFEKVGEYEILFTGQAKHRQGVIQKYLKNRDGYVIPVLRKADDLIAALNWLGTFVNYRGNTYRVSAEDAKQSRKLVNSKYSKDLGASINFYHQNPDDLSQNIKLTYHGLRDIYAAICVNWLNLTRCKTVLFSRILGHSKDDVQTSVTYDKFEILDWKEVVKDIDADVAEMVKRNSWDVAEKIERNEDI